MLRFDSLSKILSAGIRIGFLCAPEPLMIAIDMHVCRILSFNFTPLKLIVQKTAVASLQTSSLTQSITFSILDAWGYDAFKTHTRTVSQFYREKRDVFETAMRRYLDGLAEWDTPEAGMFFW